MKRASEVPPVVDLGRGNRHAAGRGDYRHALANQINCHFRQPFVLTQSPTVFNRDAMAFDVAFFRKAVAECNYARLQLCW